MNRTVVITLSAVVLAMVTIYLFVPSTVSINETIALKGNQHGLYRALIETGKWNKWFPTEPDSTVSGDDVEKSYFYRRTSYHPSQRLFDGIEVLIKKNDYQATSVISIEALKADSAFIQWKSDIETGINPVSKIRNYLFAENLKQDLSALLRHLKSFLEDRKNVYDIDIQQEKVRDTFLITLKTTLPDYPDVVTIYQMKDKISHYIESQHARVTNFPMMHVEMLDSTHYQTMVALPVDRKLADNPPLLFKRMVAGNILVAEIKGGKASINEGFKKLEDYIEDYKKESPALPFESLISDRFHTPDTSAWVTRLYYPVY